MKLALQRLSLIANSYVLMQGHLNWAIPLVTRDHDTSCRVSQVESFHPVLARSGRAISASPDAIGILGEHVLVATSMIYVGGVLVPDAAIIRIDRRGVGAVVTADSTVGSLVYPRIVSGRTGAVVLYPEASSGDYFISKFRLGVLRLGVASLSPLSAGPRFTDAGWLSSGASSYSLQSGEFSMSSRDSDADRIVRAAFDDKSATVKFDTISIKGLRLTQHPRLSGISPNRLLVVSALFSELRSRKPALFALPVRGSIADSSRAVELSRFSGLLPRFVGSASSLRNHLVVWRNESGSPASGYALFSIEGELLARGDFDQGVSELTDPVAVSPSEFVVAVRDEQQDALRLLMISKTGTRELLRMPSQGVRTRLVQHGTNRLRVLEIQTINDGGQRITALTSAAFSIHCVPKP